MCEVDGAFVECVVFSIEFECEVGGDEFLESCECDVCVVVHGSFPFCR